MNRSLRFPAGKEILRFMICEDCLADPVSGFRHRRIGAGEKRHAPAPQICSIPTKNASSGKSHQVL